MNILAAARRALFILFALFAIPLPAFAQIDLGHLGGNFATPFGINDQLLVVGESLKSNGKMCAFICDSTTTPPVMSALPDPYALGSTANGINWFNQVCGWVQVNASGVKHAWFWDVPASVSFDIQTSGGLAGLGAVSSIAHGTNDHGFVVGELTRADGSIRGFVWHPVLGAQLLPALGGAVSKAFAINLSEEVVGYSTDASGNERAFRWRALDGMLDLGAFAGSNASHAFGINETGVIVGESIVAGSSPIAWNSAAFTTDGALPTSLHTLGGANSVLRDVSKVKSLGVGTSQVAGGAYHAIYTTGSGLYDPNRDANVGWVLTDAFSTNPRGGRDSVKQYIVGYGTYNGARKAFIVNTLGTYSGIRGIGSIACNKATVVGGDSLVGTFTNLNRSTLVPEPDAIWLTARVHSGNSTALAAPYAVTIPLGASSVDFPIQTSSVSTDTAVQVSVELPPTYPAVSAITVHVVPTDTTLAVSDAAGKIGQQIALSAVLTRNFDGLPAVGKTVLFNVGGSDAGTAVTDSSGKATLPYTIPDALGTGAASVAVSFAAEGSYHASNGKGLLTVSKGDASLSLANTSGAIGQTLDLQATLTRVIGGGPIAGANVTFKVAGNSVGQAATDSAGVAHLAYKVPETLAIGAIAMSAASDTTSLFESASATATLTTAKAATTTKSATVGGLRGDTVVLSATLTRSTDLAPLPSRTITFSIGTTILGTAVTDSSGVAQKSYTIPAGAAIGTLTYSAKFPGDAKHKTSTGAGKLNVRDTTALTVSPASGMIGQTVTLSATLNRSSDGLALSGKTLTFSVNGLVIGNATTSSAGVATRSYKIPFSDSLSSGVGTRTVTVSFADETLYAGTTGSSTLTVVRTDIVVVVTNISGTPGTKLTLKASLKRVTDGGGVSFVPVIFKIDGVLIGSAKTSGTGVAPRSYTIPTTFVSGSTHTITVEFAGDANYNPGTGSGTLTVL